MLDFIDAMRAYVRYNDLGITEFQVSFLILYNELAAYTNATFITYMRYSDCGSIEFYVIWRLLYHEVAASGYGFFY